MTLLASFNGGISDSEAEVSFLIAILAAVVLGGLAGRGCLGVILGAIAGAGPAVWFLCLSRSHRPDLGDLILFFYAPAGAIAGGGAGWAAGLFRRAGRPVRTPQGGVGDRELDGVPPAGPPPKPPGP